MQVGEGPAALRQPNNNPNPNGHNPLWAAVLVAVCFLAGLGLWQPWKHVAIVPPHKAVVVARHHQTLMNALRREHHRRMVAEARVRSLKRALTAEKAADNTTVNIEVVPYGAQD